MHTERRRHGSNEGTDGGREERQNHLSSGLLFRKQFWDILYKVNMDRRREMQIGWETYPE
jgi:hypothetical protein